MTLEEFEGWSAMKETRAVKDYLVDARANYTELLHNLLTNCNDMDKIALQGARLQGMIMGINKLLEIEWEEVGGNSED